MAVDEKEGYLKGLKTIQSTGCNPGVSENVRNTESVQCENIQSFQDCGYNTPCPCSLYGANQYNNSLQNLNAYILNLIFNFL
jgi:hypothetical protein